jgi:hypothetical protein
MLQRNIDSVNLSAQAHGTVQGRVDLFLFLWGFFQEAATKTVTRHSVYFGISDLNFQITQISNYPGLVT